MKRTWAFAACAVAYAPAVLASDASAESVYGQITACLRTADTAKAAPLCAQMERVFPKHNRTGCGVLWLAQMYHRRGELKQAEETYRKATAAYARCRYGDGVQVGPMATLGLANVIARQGRREEAIRLYRQIIERYPQAKEHRGRLLADLASNGVAQQEKLAQIDYAAELNYLWDQIANTYPYFKDKGIDWRAVGAQVKRRLGSVTSDAAFVMLCQEMVSRLEDCHCRLGGIQVALPRDTRVGCGLALSPYRAKEAIVLRVAPGGAAERAGCRPGWVLTRVDSVPVADRIDQERKRSRTGYSTRRAAWYRLVNSVTLGPAGSTARLTFRTATRATRSVAVARSKEFVSQWQWIHPANTREGRLVDWALLPDNTAYVHVRAFSYRGDAPHPLLRRELDAAIQSLNAAPRVVLDLRGNGGGDTGVGLWVLSHFVAEPVSVRRWGRIAPTEPRLAAPVAVLIDAGVISAGDQTADFCHALPKRFPLLGKGTTGSSGEPVHIDMPSGIFTAYISSTRFLNSQGQVIEGRGVLPHRPVEWNPSDVAQGEDTFIKEAVAYLKGRAPAGR